MVALETRLKTLLFAALANLTIAVGPVMSAEPSAVGLWQKQDESGRTVGWFLFVERNGTYEGASDPRSDGAAIGY